LGGDDFNQVLVDDFFAVLRETFGNRRQIADPVLSERVREQAERARRLLSTQDSAVMSVVWLDREVKHKVTTERFESTGLSQTQIVKLFGVTQLRVSDLMRGKIEAFGLNVLVNMC
jgi:predicted XRE-type DNA-binding protein